jgi:hypothetical protein
LLRWPRPGCSSEAQLAGLRARLGQRRVGELMSVDPVVGPAWWTVAAFLEGFA